MGAQNIHPHPFPEKCLLAKNGGRGYEWAREIGTVCQIGVLTGKWCNFLGPEGSFSAISHYVFNECRPKTVS